MTDYIHGYSEKEGERLRGQADVLEQLIHDDVKYESGTRVLEAGCGTGGQTAILARNNLETQFVAIDISAESIGKAKGYIKKAGLSNVEFKVADIFDLPFDEESFDHIFTCFVLEHLKNPIKALLRLKEILKSGGTIRAVEGEGKTIYAYPETDEILRIFDCYFRLHTSKGGNPFIGRELFSLLNKTGLKNIKISPGVVHLDHSDPLYKKEVMMKSIIPAFEEIRNECIENGYIDKMTWEKGMKDFIGLIDDEDGVFSFTWVKAIGTK